MHSPHPLACSHLVSDESDDPTSEPRAADDPQAGARYQGPAHASPYAMSRMGPAYSLVDVAKEIEHADAMLAQVTHGKLEELASQIRAIQERAKAVMREAKRDALLHRARCQFEKKPGDICHLYRRGDGELHFSLVSPEEWGERADHAFVGSYRLRIDMTFEALVEVEVPSDVEVPGATD